MPKSNWQSIVDVRNNDNNSNNKKDNQNFKYYIKGEDFWSDLSVQY